MRTALLLTLVAATHAHEARADEWETPVDGAGSAADVEELLKYKKGQAAEIYTLFYGLRDKLYVIRPQTRTSYVNSLFTPQTVNYEVQLTASFNSQALTTLRQRLSSAAYLDRGENTFEIALPGGLPITIRLFDEVVPTFKVLIRDGYVLEARAVLLDKDRTVLAVSDNSLIVRTPLSDKRLDLSGRPLLQTYVPQEKPDIRKLLDSDDAKFKEVGTQLSKHFASTSYVLTNADKALFYSLPVNTLARSVSMRVLRESDELILYKRDK
jgi:hypothetical protein